MLATIHSGLGRMLEQVSRSRWLAQARLLLTVSGLSTVLLYLSTEALSKIAALVRSSNNG